MAAEQNACCALLKSRYSELEQKRNALRQAVKLLEQQIHKIDSDNLRLKKACEEEHSQVEFERQEKLKESSLRVSLENEISSLKSEISALQLKGGSGTQDGDGAEQEAEINKLKRLLEEEKIKVDSERKRVEAEKSEAAEAWKIVKAEKSKADKEKKIASREGTKAEEYRLQLEILKKEADEVRLKAEEANKRCEREMQKAAMEKTRADLEMSKAEEQRKLAEANENQNEKQMQLKGGSGTEYEDEVGREAEIKKLKKLLEEEKIKVDSERKRVEAEKSQAAEAWKIVKAEKSKADKEKKIASREGKKAEEYRLQLEILKKEADEARLKAEEANKRCERETQKAAMEKTRADLEMSKAEEQRKLAEANEKQSEKKMQLKGGSGTEDGDGAGQEAEINKLKRLLEEERIKVDSERIRAEAEKSKAAEAWKIVKAEKSKVDKEKKIASREGKKAEEYKLQLEILTKEADEARLKAEEANKRWEREKQKAAMEKTRADLEMSKAEEQRKLAEANEKAAMVEKSHADHLLKQLEGDRQKIEKLQKQIDELVSSRKQVEALAVPPDKSVNAKTSKMKSRHQSEKTKREADDGKLDMEFPKPDEINKKGDVGKKVMKEKIHADLEMAKAKLAKENRKKTMLEKCRADQLSQQLENHRLGIEELQKELNGLVPSGNLAETPTVPPDMDIKIGNLKLLKKKLKFEKMQVKHAKQMAKLEKDRNNILQQELGRLKQHFVQFSHRLDMLDSFLSHKVEGTNGIAKDENFSKVLQLNLKKRPSGVEPFRACLLSDNGFFNHYRTARNSSNLFSLCQEHNVPLLPISGGNYVGSISGIDSESESLLGGSDQKMLQSSAINSSMASFSDIQLMGSQERGAFSVTTSTKLAEENSNRQPTSSRFSHESTKMRYNGEFAVVAENCVKGPFAFDVVGRDNGHSKKRKRVHAIESIENLHSEDKNLHLQVEEQLSNLDDESDRNINKPVEEGSCLVSDLQGDRNAKNGRSSKKPRVSHEKEVVVKHLCHPDKQKRAEKLGTEGNDEANPSTLAPALAGNQIGFDEGCKDAPCTSDRSNQDALLDFEKLVNGDYMKLLELDNAVDEALYRIAIENPLSPTLPEIEFHAIQASEVDNPNSLEESFNEMLSNEKHDSVPSPSFDVVNLEIDSNRFKFNISDTHQNPLLLKCDGVAHSSEKPENNENANPSPIYHEGQTCSDQIFGSGAKEGMPNIPVSINKGAKFRSEDEVGAPHDNMPEFCVVFSDTKENSCISRILCAVRTCIASCHLVSQSDWMVEEIMRVLIMEVDLLPKEKVCVFFSLLLHNLSGAALRICQNILTGDFICCLDSFSAQINAVMSNVETRNLFAKLCHLDELLSLIEEFLIDKKVLVYDNVPSELLLACDSRISILVDGVDRIMSFEAASTHQLVAGSIILASICAATDHIGFICEASYDIFRVHRSDSSLLLTILHVFAHVCGVKYFTLSNYCLIMTVMKSLVTHSERQNLSAKYTSCLSSQSKVQNEFPPCIKCPFSQNAASVDIVISLLLDKLQDYAISDTRDQELIKSDKALGCGFLSSKDKAEKDFDCQEAFCVHSMKCDMPCSLNNFVITASHSGSDFSRTLCHFIDILSLVELVTSSMSWEWTCDKVVPCLLKMLNLCDMDDISAAIVILLGQLGRIGVDAGGGYEDVGVETVRCGLHSYLCKIISRKTRLPLQISTISALLGLLSVEWKEFVQTGVMDLPDVTGKSAIAHDIRKWFSSLSKEQQSFSVGLI